MTHVSFLWWDKSCIRALVFNFNHKPFCQLPLQNAQIYKVGIKFRQTFFKNKILKKRISLKMFRKTFLHLWNNQKLRLKFFWSKLEFCCHFKIYRHFYENHILIESFEILTSSFWALGKKKNYLRAATFLV